MSHHSFGPRRANWITIGEVPPLSERDLAQFEKLDAVYRTLCAMLYNYVPMSGHPGGSISSGRFVEALLFDAMNYDIAAPDREDADVLSYAAGHKALGLYAMYALRNELMRIAAPHLLPSTHDQLRLEDLLGFRRNPDNDTPLFHELESKALDGHPTPSTPFVRLATGASGVGMATSLGLAAAMADWFGDSAPRVHIVEGEGGLTPGRVAEALAFAGTASLKNVIVHVDWNQSSIDSDHVTREGATHGDYVQWDPCELFYLHDWNVIFVPDGFDFARVVSAQQKALEIDNGQPTAIVYRTTKGWRYGIEGRASHGAGHKLCSAGFFGALPIGNELDLPRCGDTTRCNNGSNAPTVEECFWAALTSIRNFLERDHELSSFAAERIGAARERLDIQQRKPRANAPAIDDLYALASIATVPRDLELKPGSETTLRGQLGKAIGFLNKFSSGSIFIAAADLLGSTSINEGAKEFGTGFFDTSENRDSRTLSTGGICEDAMSGILAGISTFGHHIGAGASYGAFIAPLGHIAARLHAIGNQARFEHTGARPRPMILICGHAGLKTGEDGPTHADPQPLQLLQENFPAGACITLTPWEPGEIWPLLSAALTRRPSLIAPFVTRPSERVPDREALGLAPASDAAQGLYLLRKACGHRDGTIVLQESGVAYAFVTDALPMLERDGIDLDVYYVASAELFDLLPPSERNRIFPEERAQEAIGITGFTLPTMYRWIASAAGRAATMHPYMHGRYPGSGQGHAVIAEAGLDGVSQYQSIVHYLERNRVSTLP
jgi:transketolase